MYRHLSPPRPDHQRIVASQGLVFHETVHPDGTRTPYWFEGAMYEFDEAEIDHLETATDRLHAMCVEAAGHLASGAMGDLGLPRGALELVRDDLTKNRVSVYGRFDLAYDGLGPAKLLEYNADTPTGLVETAVVQWYWAQDLMPSVDQWNSVHERLIAAWRTAAARLPSRTVHVAHLAEHEEPAEEWMTTAYMRDCIDQAGLATIGTTVSDLGWDTAIQRFVDVEERPIDTCFKLYPTENMLRETFGHHLLDGHDLTVWVEPVWKVVLSNKALLAALWHLFPDHENLLPAYLDAPGPLREWVRKPLHGREGDGIQVFSEDLQYLSPSQDYGAEGYCYQQWHPLPSFDGNHPVLGSWVVDGVSAGLGIRESQSYVTDYFARFVPHVISAPLPDQATRATWLSDPSTT